VDWHVVETLNAAFARHDGMEDLVTLLERAAPAVYALILLGVFGFASIRDRLRIRLGVVAGVMSAGIALVVVQVVGRLVDRPRPFVEHPHHVHNFLHHVADAGFPSDHATALSAVSVALLLRSRRLGAAIALLSVIVMVGRVALGAHYPSDVAVGALLGAASAGLLSFGPIAGLVDRVTSGLDRLTHHARPRPVSPALMTTPATKTPVHPTR
jgi:undecaprenyl-diphosphatase